MRGLVFDFDGTLLNSFDLYCRISNKYFRFPENCFSKECELRISNSISAGGAELFAAVIGDDYSDDNVVKFRQGQLELVSEEDLFLSRNQFKRLAEEYELFLYSSKPHDLCLLMLRKLNLLKYFREVNGLNGPYLKKPSKQFLEHVQSHYRLSHLVYIGDSDVDFSTATTSNIDYLHCDWGYGPDLNRNDYFQIFNCPLDLFDYLIYPDDHHRAI